MALFLNTKYYVINSALFAGKQELNIFCNFF